MKSIPGFSRYLIDKHGNIFSAVAWSRWKAGRQLTPSINHKGYYALQLINDDGKRKTSFVHRLIAMTYISNPHNKPQVNHIDGNKLNNDVQNLEWATPSENSIHMLVHGLSKSKVRGSYLGCPVCKNQFWAAPSSKRKYCSRECFRSAMRVFYQGRQVAKNRPKITTR